MTAVRRRIRALALVASFIGTVSHLYTREPDETHPDRGQASHRASQEAPRVIVRADAGLLGLPNSGPQGGGGISIPNGGTGAGLLDTGGVELGAEVRASQWITFDAAAGRYRPELEVGRYQGPDQRSDSVALRTARRSASDASATRTRASSAGRRPPAMAHRRPPARDPGRSTRSARLATAIATHRSAARRCRGWRGSSASVRRSIAPRRG